MKKTLNKRKGYRNKDTRYLEKVAEDKRQLRNFLNKESIKKLGRKFNMSLRDRQLARLAKMGDTPHARLRRRQLGVDKVKEVAVVKEVVEKTTTKAKKVKSIFKKKKS